MCINTSYCILNYSPMKVSCMLCLEKLFLIFIFQWFSALFSKPVLQKFFCHLAQTHFITLARVFHRFVPCLSVDDK